MKSFVVIGGKWFDKVNGNTYHTAKIIDGQTGETYFSRFQYGYGSQYLQSAREYIKDTLNILDCNIIDGGSFYIKKADAKYNNF